MRTVFLVAAAALASGAPARAHYHMLLPDRHSVKAGGKVVVTYQFGHPFEHELFDAEKPVRALMFDPEGNSTDLLPGMGKVEVPGRDGTKVAAYRITFQPTARGDFTLVVESPPVWMAAEKHFVHDVCKVVIHAETQKGWDRSSAGRDEFAIRPMTRPYGLRAGMVFQAHVRAPGIGAVHAVEVERFNPAPPAALPPDEHITLALRTDSAGVATCTLPDPGWWAVTAIRGYRGRQGPEMKERDGKPYPVIDRATLWVHVDDKVPLKPAE